VEVVVHWEVEAAKFSLTGIGMPVFTIEERFGIRFPKQRLPFSILPV
jgi:hypothetical protein